MDTSGGSTEGGASCETAFPHLKTLLRFDTQGLLNVMSIAFEEPEFNGELGTCQKQRLVDILLKIMVPPPPSPASTPEKTADTNGGTTTPQRQDSQVRITFIKSAPNSLNYV